MNNCVPIGWIEPSINGNFYRFIFYNLSDRNLPESPGVFMITSFGVWDKPMPYPCPCFIYDNGITDNLKSEIASASAWNEWVGKDADAILFARIDDIKTREEVYSWLINAYRDV